MRAELASVHDMPYVHVTMNMKHIVNTRQSKRPASRVPFVKALDAILAQVLWVRASEALRPAGGTDSSYDVRVDLTLPEGDRIALCVVCKNEMRPVTFGMLAEKRFSPIRGVVHSLPVLALPWVSPRITALCQQHGWSWFDLEGNCRIEIPGLLFIERQCGRLPRTKVRPLANLGTMETGRILRVLLHVENMDKRWTQRELQSQVVPAVSLGLINKVVRYLRDEAFLDVDAEKRLVVRDPRGLLFAWRDAYRPDAHRRLGYFTLLQGAKQRQALATFAARTGGFAAYAGFSAADFLAPHVRQPRTWLYLREEDITLFEHIVEAKPVDSGENLVLLLPKDQGVFHLVEEGADRMPTTSVVQTYMDLFHSGGRGVEAADSLLEQRLEPQWKTLERRR